MEEFNGFYFSEYEFGEIMGFVLLISIYWLDIV